LQEPNAQWEMHDTYRRYTPFANAAVPLHLH